MSQTMTLDKDKVLGLWEGGSTAVADWWDTHVHPTSPQNCGGVGLATSDHTAHLRPPARSASAALGVPPTLARARRFSSARSGCSIKLKNSARGCGFIMPNYGIPLVKLKGLW